MTMYQCSSTCKNGKQCSRKVSTGGLCTFHLNQTSDRVSNKSTANVETCVAICSNGKKCIRKSCLGMNYCGTHKNLTAIETIKNPDNDNTTLKNLTTCMHSIFVEDVGGIAYYMDSNGNVFSPEDVLQQSLTPRIIAKYILQPPNQEYKLTFVQ